MNSRTMRTCGGADFDAQTASPHRFEKAVLGALPSS